ncbi:HNH endonuclease, partial [Brevibacillus formosus]
MGQPLYKSRRWKRKRATILRRDQYMCRESKRYGKTEPTTTVHHIYPLEFYPELVNPVNVNQNVDHRAHQKIDHHGKNYST